MSSVFNGVDEDSEKNTADENTVVEIAKLVAQGTIPAPPTPDQLPDKWKHRELHDRVKKALLAMPSRFESTLTIEGVPVTDLFTMNTPLGAAIEAAMVDTLNQLRTLWDPDQQYASYEFVRQPQTFPDVLLRSNDLDSPERVLMGIELKGWFAVAKEREPSFRYYASANVCAPQDLLVIVPWVFDSVISGKPKLMQPIITEAAYAAKMRNFHWQHVRRARDPAADCGIDIAPAVGFYPSRKQNYSDQAKADKGRNFGRIARCGVMDNEVDAVLREDALGVPVEAWCLFLAVFTEAYSRTNMLNKLRVMRDTYIEHFAMTPEIADEISEKVAEIAYIIKDASDKLRQEEAAKKAAAIAKKKEKANKKNS